MTKFPIFVASVFVVLAANTVCASSVCPIMVGGSTVGGGGGVNPAYIAASGATNGGCNVLITFNASGSISTTFPNPAISYDLGLDDNLVGIINNRATPLPSVTLTGHTLLDSGGVPSATFGFETDGACDPGWMFAGGNPCGTTTSGYGHQGVTLSSTSPDNLTGVVNFAGGIPANGGTAWFSLEGPVDLNLQVTSGVPEPGTFGTLAVGLTGVVLWARKRIHTKRISRA